METKYCRRVIEGLATLIVYSGCYDEVICTDVVCSELGSENDTVQGIDGIKRRFCQTKGLNLIGNISQ